MHEVAPFFRDFALVFIAAMIGGALAWRLRQPLILGYVVAGILIGRFTPGPAVTDMHTMELLSEVGVILLMFSVGMEFSIRELLRVKWVALLGGTLGILLSIGLGIGMAALFDWSLTQGVVIGAVISVASTMVLTRLLIDRGELNTEAGRVMVSITLFEDLAVVVMTILFPSFGNLEAARVLSVLQALGIAALILVPALFVAFQIVPRILTRVARTHNQELFFVVVLAICMGTAALTQGAGLSLALGAFIAGVIISGSDYVHEALAQVFPLRDAFVALFFVTLGTLVDPSALISNLELLGAMLVLILFGKLLIWGLVVKLFGYPIWTALMVGIGLTQIGEFSFILVKVAQDSKLVGSDVYNATLAASLVSILINAALVRYAPGWIARMRLERETRQWPELGHAEGEHVNHVVMCGFGRVGSAIGTALDTFDVPYVVVELDPDIVKSLRSRGIGSIYGDATYTRILEEAKLSKASLLIVTVPEIDRALGTVQSARRIHENIPILARAHRNVDRESLLKAGATEIIQPEIEASTALLRSALEYLKLPEKQTAAYMERFRNAMDSVRMQPIPKDQALPDVDEVVLSGDGLVNQTLRDSSVRDRFGVTVVAISRESGEVILNPPSEAMLQRGDRVRVFGMPEQISAFANAARSDSEQV